MLRWQCDSRHIFTKLTWSRWLSFLVDGLDKKLTAMSDANNIAVKSLGKSVKKLGALLVANSAGINQAVLLPGVGACVERLPSSHGASWARTADGGQLDSVDVSLVSVTPVTGGSQNC